MVVDLWIYLVSLSETVTRDREISENSENCCVRSADILSVCVVCVCVCPRLRTVRYGTHMRR